MRTFFQQIIRTAILFLICLSLLLGCSTAPVKPESAALGDYEYTKQYFSRLIKKEMKSHNIAGLSIALVDDQRIVWAAGFGYADKANNLPATPETVYGVGSISKLFTATAAMQLAEQGKLDIDKPLQTYLPEFSMKTRFTDPGPVTPRSIMTHHSSLPSDLRKGMWSKNPEPFTSVVDRIKDEYVA
jgi:CubicO group peptidase (beta-lactamase class C family)